MTEVYDEDGIPTLAWREKSALSTPLHPRPHAALARRAGKIKPAPSSWVLLFRRRTPYNVGFYYRGGLRAVCFTALARLQDGSGESFPDLPGTRIIDVAFPLNDAFDPLLWCGQQAQWPQFYWQQRNGDEELATLGAVKTFTSLDAANRFYAVGRQDLRICGLNAFEPQQGSCAAASGVAPVRRQGRAAADAA